MTKLRSLLVTLGALAAVAGGNAMAGQLDDIKAAGVITVGTEGNYPPYTHHDAKGKLTGFDVEFARALAEKLGVKAQFKENLWDGMIAGLDAKRFDVVINQVGPTPERAQKYLFSEPYVYDYASVLVNKNNNEIKDLEDVKGKRVTSNLTSNWNRLARSLGANIVEVPDASAGFILVSQGRADAAINSQIALHDFLKKQPNANVKIVGRSKEAMTSVVLIRKGSDDLKAAIDKAIKELQDEGFIKKISLEFLNVDASSK